MSKSKFFQGCSTVAEIKSQYRKLAFENHPDLGGTNEAMREVNAAYEEALEALNGTVYQGDDGKAHTYYYNQAVEQELMDKIYEIIAAIQANEMQGVTVEIIGTWVWVGGNTYPYRSHFGKAGLKLNWHSKRKCWYWRKFNGGSRYTGRSFETLRQMYGSKVVDTEEQVAGAVVPA